MNEPNNPMLEAVQEIVQTGYDLHYLRDLARQLTGTQGITGAHKEAAAQIITDFARCLRVARAALYDNKGA